MKTVINFLSIVLFLAGASLSFAEEIKISAAGVHKPVGGGVPKTGQTRPLHAANLPYDLGDDGATQTGASEPGGRYKDNGDNTVTDNVTGLMWIKSPKVIGTVGGYNWNGKNFRWSNVESATNAFSAIAALNVNGYPAIIGKKYKDWRMPNYREALSIFQWNRQTPIAPPPAPAPWPFAFIDDYSVNYWTSTTDARDPLSAWPSNCMYVPKTYSYKCSTCPVRDVTK